MKIRTSYVSNSSSSSFICWGQGAEQYAEGFDDGVARPVELVAVDVWYSTVFPHSCWHKEFDPQYIHDDEWIEEFRKSPHGSLSGKLPASLATAVSKADNSWDVKKIFVDWFTRQYKDEKFWEVEFSDHDCETQYPEWEMEERCRDWEGSHLFVNNH